MAQSDTYPHVIINVSDYSIYTPIKREILPLFLPIFFAKCQQGQCGVPVYLSDLSTAKQVFGEETFTVGSKYFSRESLYLTQLLSRQGVFLTRMAASDAKEASVVLQLSVKRVQVPQYQRNEYGQFLIDEVTQEPIPIIDSSSGQPITEPGLELKWTTRPLGKSGNRDESINNLKIITQGSGVNQVVTYPILAAKASSVGEYGNNTGFKFFTDIDNMDQKLVSNLSAIEYNFGIIRKNSNSDNPTTILSSFQNQFESFVAKPNAEDTRTARKVSFEDVLDTNYVDKLPWDLHLYSENIEAIGKLVMEVETNNEELDDPYLVNLCEPYDLEGVPYSHVVLSTDDDSIHLNESRVIYLQNGEDGTIDDDTIEMLTRDYLNTIVYPEILDSRRYPFTHIVDVGVHIETKYAFIDFLGKHEAFKVILSTQDTSLGRFNTKAEDMSTGSALFARCLLQPESVIKGTECCRAEIYQQAGYLNDSIYRDIVPSTFDICYKKSRYLSSQTITGQAAGLPNSEITFFKTWNWTPCDADHKQRSWDSGLNYFQYYNMTGIHWPAMRTVYRYDTSVLSNALFTDVVVFVKHIVAYNWARFAGVELPFDLVKTQATSAVSNDLAAMLNGFFRYNVEFYQTEEEANLGYKSHCTVQLWGNPQQRVWEIDIECYRTGFDPNSSGE